MSSKLTQLDKAIAGLDHKIAILQAARQELVQQQAKTPKRTKPTKKDTRVDTMGEPDRLLTAAGDRR